MRLSLPALKFRFGFQVFFAGALTFLLTCMGLAFLGQTHQNDWNPENTSSSFHLADYPHQLERSEGMQMLAEQAKAYRVNLYQPSIFELDALSGARLIFAFVGDPDTFPYELDPATGQAAVQRMPDFNPNRITCLKPYTDSQYNAVTGAFGFSGDKEQMRAFITELENKGFDIDYRKFRRLPASPSLSAVLFMMEGIPDPGVLIIFLVVTLLLGAVSVHAALRRYKVAAIRIVGGEKALLSIAKECAIMQLAYALCAAIVALIGSAAIWLYNGGQLLGRLLLLYLLLVMLGAAAVFLFQAITILLLQCRPLAQLLKGWRPRKLLVGLGYAVLLLSFYLAGQGTVSTAKNTGPLTYLLSDQSLWEGKENIVTAAVSNFLGRGIKDTDDKLRLGWVARQLEKENKLLIATPGRTDVKYQQALKLNPSDVPMSSMNINNAFLQRHPVYGADGKRIQNLPSGPGIIHMLVPENLVDNKAVQWVVNRWPENSANIGVYKSALMQQETYRERATPEVYAKYALKLETLPPEVDMRIIYTKPNQEFFSYLPLNKQSPVIKNTIFTVLSTDSGAWADGEYSSSPFGGVYSTDPQRMIELIQEAGLQVREISSPALQNLSFIQEQLAAIRMAIGVALAAMLVALSAGGVLALAYVDKHRRRLAVEEIHGYSFLERHWRFLGLLTLLGTVAYGLVFGIRVKQVNLTDGGPDPTAPLPALFGRLGEKEKLFLMPEQEAWAQVAYALIILLTVATAAAVCAVQSRKVRLESLAENG